MHGIARACPLREDINHCQNPLVDKSSAVVMVGWATSDSINLFDKKCPKIEQKHHKSADLPWHHNFEFPFFYQGGHEGQGGQAGFGGESSQESQGDQGGETGMVVTGEG